MNLSGQQPWDVDASDFPEDGSQPEAIAFLLQYAILAPSSHNSQPWQFEIVEDGVRVFVDTRRWLRVADPDQRELHISVGCALENLLIAAAHFGFNTDVSYFPEGADSDLAAAVKLKRMGESARSGPATLFDAIPVRHTNHRQYDGRPFSQEEIRRIEGLAQESGIECHLTEEPAIRRVVDDLVVRADALQFADPAWREELGEWLGKGVFGSGWLMSKMSQLAVTYLNMGQSTAKKDSNLLDSASALGLITAHAVDRPTQIKVGQTFERLFLTATACGMALQPMNQILQVPDVKTEFKQVLPPAWGEPQITFRMGYAEPEKHTPRQVLSDVLRANRHSLSTP